MNNYEKTKKLLNEPTFLEVVSKLYEDFISFDLDEYDFFLQQEMDFYLSVQRWVNRYNDRTKTRLLNGHMVPFSVYVNDKLNKGIMDDWSTFNKQLEGQSNISKLVSQFKAETLEMIRLIPMREHLTLIGDKLVKALQRIAEQEELKLASPSMLQNNGVPPLKWNGQADTLYTLFFDLTNRMSKATGKFFLEADKDQIIAFIKANFLKSNGEPFDSTTSMKTYLDPSRLDKKAKNERFVLMFDYEDPKAKK